MGNSFYTLKCKICECPLWPTKVKITAKYKIREDDGHSAHLTATECEIVHNLHLPKSKRNKELEMFCYCTFDNCPCLKVFEKEITLP